MISLLSECFTSWREHVFEQQAHQNEATLYLETKCRDNQVRMAFTFWRRHFRATLVARYLQDYWKLKFTILLMLMLTYTFTLETLNKIILICITNSYLHYFLIFKSKCSTLLSLSYIVYATGFVCTVYS